MRDVACELKALRLHGMAAAWAEMENQDHEALEAAAAVFEQLLQAEGVDRAVRAVRYQMSAARLPTHRDLAGFDFGCSPVDRKLVLQLAECGFAQPAYFGECDRSFRRIVTGGLRGVFSAVSVT